MKEIDVYKEYHSDIVKAWEMVEKEPEFKEICNLEAFAQDTLYKNGLLFLGIGASNGKKEDKNGKKKEDTCKIHGHVQYETEDGRNSYAYYQPIIKLTKETGFGDNWSNIDITLFRETSQKNLIPFFRKFPEIMKKQLELAIKMIIDTDPKIIIVSNALVRDVLKTGTKKSKIESSGFVFHFDNDYGTDIIDTPEELKGRPIFFTSMLSGAGALDNGSFARLRWHINYVQKHLNH
jgi:hypothetical protein